MSTLKDKTYEQLLGQYLELLDESTGYNFTNRELIMHTIDWDYEELMWNLVSLARRLGEAV